MDNQLAWLEGSCARCDLNDPPPPRPYRMVLLGAPGVGKGTQAEYLCQNLGTCHLSTGDVFRAAKGSQAHTLSPAMQSALTAMKRGELVSDETVEAMVRERAGCLACRHGFLLDGFPRTVHQARALSQMLGEVNQALDAVLDYELPLDQTIARLSGRRTCRQCGTTFHVLSKPPKVEGVCDQCGGALFQREDDQPESIRVRLKAYEEDTKPLVEYYKERGLLVTVSAEGSPEEIFQRTQAALNGKGAA